MSPIAPRPGELMLLEQAIRNQLGGEDGIMALYRELHMLAYDGTGSDVKVRLSGSDPTGDQAIAGGTEAMRSALVSAAGQVADASKRLRAAIGILRAAVRSSSVQRSQISHWTSDDVAHAEERAWRRQRTYRHPSMVPPSDPDGGRRED